MLKSASYKISAAIFFTIFVTMIIPLEFEQNETEQKFYGYATIVKLDEKGNNIFTQQIHNRLVDTG